jgi:predicted GNAT family acetyltransferase
MFPYAMSMEIQHEDQGKKGEFYVEEAGKRVAKLQYFHSREGEINAYHTEVADSLAGQGIGKKLVTALAAFAREKNVKVHATCTYAHKIMSGSDEYKDLLV